MSWWILPPFVRLKTLGSNFDYYNIDVTTLNNGIYNLVLTVGESMTTKKLQILK